MLKYIIKRLLMLIPVVIGISFLVFFILKLTPGDPAKQMLGDNASVEALAQLNEELGFNDPLLVQYGRYVLGLLKGNMGYSYTTNRDVFTEITSRFPVTLTLAISAMIISIAISIPVGIISATKQYSAVDTISMVSCLIGVSMPSFWLGLMLILLFSVQFNLLPSYGADTPLHYVLPAFTLGIGGAANIARMTRSSMLEVIRQDYIRTAKAKGVKGKDIIRKHALKNALMPIVTVIGIQFGSYLGGAIMIETVFSLPGTGRYMLDGIRSKDIPSVLGSVIVFSVLYSLINLLVDILYSFIDPRIRSEYS